MSTPLIIAHRGASDSEPEHTLAAYQQALVDGADGWECDVRLTLDNHLICMHDRRLNRTSNGTGAVSKYRLADLEKLDFGSQQKVLTLEQLLQFFVDTRGALRLYIETKHPARGGSRVEQKLIELLRKFNLDKASDKVTILSFWPRPLRRIHLAAPALPTAQVMVTVPPMFRNGSLPYHIPITAPQIRLLRAFPDYVRRAKAAGKQVLTWVVNEPRDIDLALSLGVDAIITDTPTTVRNHIACWRSACRSL